MTPSAHESQAIYLNDNLVGECYLGFSKLLQSELRRMEKRDSTILSNRMSRMSNRLSHVGVGNNKMSIRQKSFIPGGGFGRGGNNPGGPNNLDNQNQGGG